MNLTSLFFNVRVFTMSNARTSGKLFRSVLKVLAPSYGKSRFEAPRLVCPLVLAALFPYLAYAQSANWAPLGAPAGPISQGNPIVNSPASVQTNADGRLELFIQGDDGAVWHIWENQPRGVWGGWSSLGTPGRPFLGPITAGKNQDGRLEVFAVDYFQVIWHNSQTSPGGSWGGWHLLCQLSPGYFARSMAIANNYDGRLELFTLSTETVGHVVQVQANGSWSGWSSLGSPPHGSTVATTTSIAAALDAMHQLELFLTQDDPAYLCGSNVFFINQVGPGGSWSGWQNLWSPPVCGLNFSPPAIGINANGTLDIFVGDGLGTVWHRWQTGGGGWTWVPDWVSLGTAGPAGPGLKIPSAGRNSDGSLEVFATGNDGALWTSRQTTPGGAAWSGWNSLGIAPGTSGMSSRTVIGVDGGWYNPFDPFVWPGALEVFSIASQEIWRGSQIIPGLW